MIRRVARSAAVALATPELMSVLTKLVLHEVQLAVHSEKHAFSFATVRLLVAVESPLEARAVFAEDTNAEFSFANAVCFAEMREAATVAAVLTGSPPLVSVFVRLELHAAQFVVH